MWLLLRSAARFHLRSPLQLLLCVAGIALGVAVYIGVDVANNSATGAFQASADFVRGSATHRLLPLGEYLDEEIYVEYVAALGIIGAPVLEEPVTVGNTRIRATLLGIDAIEEADFRDVTRPGLLGGSAPNALITEAATAIVAPALLDTADAAAISVHTDLGDEVVRVLGTIPGNTTTAPLIITDIATAQEILSLNGKLSRIDLILEPDELTQLRAALPPELSLVAAGNDDLAFRQLSNAFRINILALGLLALAIGMFLVYSSANFSLVRRARTHAILNCLGMQRHQLAAAIILEFALLGIVASLLGVVLGYALAKALVGLMLITIDDFALRRSAAVESVSVWLYSKGLILGVTATVAAAFAPIRHAVQRDTGKALRHSAEKAGTTSRMPSGLRFAALCLLVAAATLWWPGGNLTVAFFGLFAALAASACAIPALSSSLVTGLHRLIRFFPGFLARHAARNVLAQQSRIAVATSALALAVACVVGVGIMIGSFRASLQAWLDTTLTSDIYVTLARDSELTDDLLRYLREDSRITGISLTRLVSLPGEFGTTTVRAFQPGTRGWGLQLVDGDPQSVIAQLEAGTAIAITEPFAMRTGLVRGDRLTLPGETQKHTFAVAGIYRNYDAGASGLLMSLAAYREMAADEQIDGIGIEADRSVDIDLLERDIAARLPVSAYRISDTTGIKRLSLEIFDRTFLITEVLRILAGSVAFLGMLSALMAIQTARRREFGILRSLGFDPARLTTLIVSETAIIGTSAGLLALPVGAMLAALLVYVINVRSFGWTMELQLQPSALAAGLALAVAAAVLAGIAPALSSSRRPVAYALRDD